MWETIKKYWDLLGGIICGVITSLLARFQMNKIQTVYSVIILILVFIGFFKVIRSYFHFAKRKNTTLDKMADGQKPMKAISMAQNPTKQGEELANLLIETGKGGKVFMKKVFLWIKNYWQQLIGLIGAFVYTVLTVYALALDKVGFALAWLPESEGWQIGGKIVLGLFSALFVFYIVRNQVKWAGVGSIDKAIEYLNSLHNQVYGKLSPEAKSKVKQSVKALKSECKKLNTTINNLNILLTKYGNEANSLKELITIGIGDPQSLTSINEKIAQTQNDLAVANQRRSSIEEQISKYSQVL